MTLGSAMTSAALALPDVHWVRAAPPVDARPLMICKDAKGDGHFLAPRSGSRRHRGIDLVAELIDPQLLGMPVVEPPGGQAPAAAPEHSAGAMEEESSGGGLDVPGGE